MFCGWHLGHQLLEALCALEGLSVPRQGRGGTVELGQVGEACVGVIGGVVDAGEVVCGACCDVDAVGGEKEKRLSMCMRGEGGTEWNALAGSQRRRRGHRSKGGAVM